MGGYVSAIALADSKDSFLKDVFAELEARKLAPDDEYDDIEDISEKFLNGDLSDEWLDLSSRAVKNGLISFTTFNLYTAE